MKYKKLVIEYGNDNMPVEYKLLDYDIVQRWAERLIAAQNFPYPIDHPDRFYGFDPIENQIESAITNINLLCSKIEQQGIRIDRILQSINDQDTLNYLHSIFENYHGLLDNKLVSDNLEKILCDLNIAVHRCESIQRGADPRHVVTYFGLPKTKVLLESDYQHFTNEYTFGSVYLNYVEIGKTLEDLALDNDKYISENAFQPFRHYSADFNVKFYNSNPKQIANHNQLVDDYYQRNSIFFEKKGLTKNSVLLKKGTIPLATLYSRISIDDLTSRQYVKKVKLYE